MIAILILPAACEPAPAPCPDDEPLTGSSSGGAMGEGESTGGDVEPEQGSTDESSGSDSSDSTEESSGSDSTGAPDECLLPASGRACLDTFENLPLCDGIEPRTDCAIALGRIFGSDYLAGVWALEPDAPSGDCAELEGVAGCALRADDDCTAVAMECVDAMGPPTCPPVDPVVVNMLCERLAQ